MAKVRINKSPSFYNGGQVRDKSAFTNPNDEIFNDTPSLTRKVKIKGPNGSATQLSNNPYSSPIFQFNGPSHDNGGIPISYKGQQVEVEGDETAYIDNEGDLNVFGNLYIPGTKTKFKKAGKNLAKQEEKANKRFTYAQKVMDKVKDPDNQWDRLKMNAGTVMTKAALNQLEAITNSKEDLANIQNTLLDESRYLNISPQQLYGRPSKAPKAQDGTTIPLRPSPLPPYEDSPSFVPDYIGASNPIFPPRDTLGYDLDRIPIVPPKNPQIDASLRQPIPTSVSQQEPPEDTRIRSITTPTYQDPLSFSQVLPELFTLATNRRESVPSFTYQPQLLTPYRVSFRDRLNQNNATFRAIVKQAGNNPALLSQLAAGKYQADTGILGEQFRTNQQIQNMTTNQNVELTNQARQANIQLAQQQNTAQAQNAAATRATTREAIKSLSAKTSQQRRHNAQMTLINQLFPNYKYNPQTNQIEFSEGNAYITVNGVPAFNPDIQKAYGQTTNRDYIRDEKGKIRRIESQTTPGFMKILPKLFNRR